MGELVGFTLRPELIITYFINNEYDWKNVKRIIRILVFLNRLIKEGKTEDFQLVHIKDGHV